MVVRQLAPWASLLASALTLACGTAQGSTTPRYCARADDPPLSCWGWGIRPEDGEQRAPSGLDGPPRESQSQSARRSRAHTNGRKGAKTYVSWGSHRMNARLFETTETLEKAIAAPASAGLSRPTEAIGMSVAL